MNIYIHIMYHFFNDEMSFKKSDEIRIELSIKYRLQEINTGQNEIYQMTFSTVTWIPNMTKSVE